MFCLVISGSFLEYLCVGVCYSDPQVAAAVSYALIPIYAEQQIRDALPLTLGHKVMDGLLEGLAEASSQQECQINMLGRKAS